METTLTAERKDQFLYEMPDILREGAKFAIRAFDIQRHGIEGELYVFTRVDSEGESWDAWADAYYRYPKLDPRASKPFFPTSLYCIHGISADVRPLVGQGPGAERLDFRGGRIPLPSLSREGIRFSRRGPEDSLDDRVATRWTEIIKAHLDASPRANSPDGWRYKQALAADLPTTEFWATLPDMIPIHAKHETLYSSLQHVLDLPVIATIMSPQTVGRLRMQRDRKAMPQPDWVEDIPGIFAEELDALSKAHRVAIFHARSIDSTKWLPSGHFVMYWKNGSSRDLFGGPDYRPSLLCVLADSFTIGFSIHAIRDSIVLESNLFNAANPFVQWALQVKRASADGAYGLTTGHFDHLYELLQKSCEAFYNISDLSEYVAKWRAMPGLPDELCPPSTQILPQMFIRTLLSDSDKQ